MSFKQRSNRRFQIVIKLGKSVSARQIQHWTNFSISKNHCKFSKNFPTNKSIKKKCLKLGLWTARISNHREVNNTHRRQTIGKLEPNSFLFFFQTSCLIQNNFFNKVHLSFLPIYPKKENWKVKMTNSASSEPMTARGFFNCWLKHEISEAKRFLIHSLIAGEFSRIFLHKFSNPHRGIGSSCCGLAAHSQCCYSQWLDNSCALLVVFELDSIDTK